MSSNDQDQQENQLSNDSQPQNQNQNQSKTQQLQLIKELSYMALEQQKSIEELEARVDELTDKLRYVRQNADSSIYSPHIFIILCLIFLVAQASKRYL